MRGKPVNIVMYSLRPDISRKTLTQSWQRLITAVLGGTLERKEVVERGQVIARIASIGRVAVRVEDDHVLLGMNHRRAALGSRVVEHGASEIVGVSSVVERSAAPPAQVGEIERRGQKQAADQVAHQPKRFFQHLVYSGGAGKGTSPSAWWFGKITLP